MLSRCVRSELVFIARRCAPVFLGFMALVAPLRAQTEKELPPVKIGAGLQTSFIHTKPDDVTSTDRVLVNSVRLYINGSATENIKFMLNTEYDGGTNKVGILDAVA